ncbi:MAG: hypothetical protein ACXWEY_12515, partial [Bacteroidia bacterium]
MFPNRIKLPIAIQHSAWSVMDAAVYPAVYLATVPLMIKSLGLVLFGVWIVLSSLITILQLFNLNLGVTAMRNVAFALGENNKKNISNTINGVILITAALLLFVTVSGAVLADVVVRYNWWGISADIENISLCIFLASIFAGLKYFDQVFQSIIKAKEEFKLAAILNTANRFGLLFITLTLAVAGFSIDQILLANILFISCYLLIQFTCIHKIFPCYKPGFETNKGLYKNLLSFSIWPWLQVIMVVLTFQTDRFWVSAFAGLSEVSGYGLVSTMFNHIHIIFTAMAIWLLPRLSAMASKNIDPLQLYEKAKSGLMSIMLVSLLVFHFVSPFILKTWLGPEAFSEVSIYVKPFIAFEMIFAYSILPVIYFNATGKEKLATLATLFYCALTYIFMLGGLYIFNNTVALVEGMILSMCISMPIINLLTLKNINSLRSGAKTLLEMIPVYAAILLLYSQNIYLSIILLLVFAFMLWKLYLSGLIDKVL